MTARRFELTSQRQKVSSLPTEPPGRPAYGGDTRIETLFIYLFIMATETTSRRTEQQECKFYTVQTVSLHVDTINTTTVSVRATTVSVRATATTILLLLLR